MTAQAQALGDLCLRNHILAVPCEFLRSWIGALFADSGRVGSLSLIRGANL